MDIKTAIEETGLKRMELALKMQVSFETIRKWERDNRIPNGPANILFWRLHEESTKTSGKS